MERIQVQRAALARTIRMAQVLVPEPHREQDLKVALVLGLEVELEQAQVVAQELVAGLGLEAVRVLERFFGDGDNCTKIRCVRLSWFVVTRRRLHFRIFCSWRGRRDIYSGQ